MEVARYVGKVDWSLSSNAASVRGVGVWRWYTGIAMMWRAVTSP